MSTVVATSAGEEVGDFGRIFMDGTQVSPNGRGYNLAAICQTGPVAARTFDTHLDSGASTQMAEFLTGLAPGCLVVAAVADEASMNLGDAAVNALRAVGADTDLHGKFRWSHALIGVDRCPRHNRVGGGRTGLPQVTVSLGPAITQSEVAAAFRWIRYDAD